MNGRTGMLRAAMSVVAECLGVLSVSVIPETAVCHMVLVCALDKYKNGCRLLT
jgi:hypothetical protein